jgi:predicted transcriptional regulator
MPAVATTFRIDPRLKDQLGKLGEMRRTPMNKLVNHALERYVAQEYSLLEAELEASLDALRAQRRQDPDFDAAIDRFARAEAAGVEDPVEGQAFRRGSGEPAPPAHGTTARLRDLLSE